MRNGKEKMPTFIYPDPDYKSNKNNLQKLKAHGFISRGFQYKAMLADKNL